jgi:hypothetical protein
MLSLSRSIAVQICVHAISPSHPSTYSGLQVYEVQ